VVNSQKVVIEVHPSTKTPSTAAAAVAFVEVLVRLGRIVDVGLVVDELPRRLACIFWQRRGVLPTGPPPAGRRHHRRATASRAGHRRGCHRRPWRHERRGSLQATGRRPAGGVCRALLATG